MSFIKRELHKTPERNAFKKAFTALFLTLQCMAGNSFAGNPSSYDFELFDASNGLERMHVNDIEVDESGFLWLATEKGIIRYDRKNFVEIGLHDEILEKSNCRSLHIKSDRLYAVFPGVGFVVVNLKDLTDVYSEKCVISDLSPISEKEYAVLLSNGRLDLRRNTTHLNSKNLKTRKPGNIIFHDRLLFLSIPDRGIFRLDPKTLELLDSGEYKPSGYLSSFSIVNDKLFLFDEYGYYGWDGNKWIKRPQWFGLKGDEHMTVAHFDKKGNIIYNRYQRFIDVIDKNLNKSTFEADSVRNFEFYSLNSNGSLIFAGTNQGLLMISQKKKPPVIINDNIRDNEEHVRIRRKILELENGELLLFGFPFTYRYTNGKFNQLSEKRFSVVDATIIGDTVYAATEGSGLLAIHLPSGEAETIISKGNLDAHGFYSSIVPDQIKKLLLLGGFGKLIAIDPYTRKTSHHAIPSPTASIRCILRPPGCESYFLGTSEGLFITNTDFRIIGKLDAGNGLGGSTVSDLLYDSGSRSLYVAHEQGVTAIDPFSRKVKGMLDQEHFKNPRAVSLLKDGIGRIWVGTFSGLVCFDPKDSSYLSLSRNNNLVNAEYNFKSATALKDGRLVFGGLNCYDVIDPSTFTFQNNNDKGIITGYHLFNKYDTVFHSPIDEGTLIKFNIDQDLLRIYLSSNGPDPESNSEFQYAIDDGTWTPTGSEPYLDIFLLEPGLYKLKFRSFDNFGNTIEYPSILISASVPFYESGWFIWTIVGIAVFALLLYSTSYSRHNKQMVALRDKIAMDLHDEVGSILTYSLYQTKTKDSSEIKNSLQHNLREAIYALRVYVKSIDQQPKRYLALIDGVREFLSSTFPSDSYEVSLKETHDTDSLLSAELYRDIKLCIFELCTNILKHSDARKIELSITKTKESILVSISDDGSERVDSGTYGSSGSGSKNIAKRAARYDGKAEYSTGPNSKGLKADIFFKT